MIRGMRHRTLRGRIDYLHDQQGERGREWFTITAHADGARTLRAQCEMDDEDLLRDVTYSVDARWRPLDAFVRLVRQDQFVGSAWFRFHDRGAECEAFTVADGRTSQRVELERRPTLFAAHPLVGDGWQAAAYDFSRGPGRQRLELCTNSSSRPDGGSGPSLGVVHKDLEFVGEETVTVPAGRFRARRMRIHPLMPAMAHWPPLEFWVAGEDNLLVRMRWDLLESSYDLVELEGELR
jgi:hypothetical protein